MQIDDLLEMLRKNPGYQNVLKLAKNEAERQVISSTTEKFILDFANYFVPLQNQYDDNPNEFIKNIQEEARQIIKDGPTKK
jgi:hypothetical protein